MFNLSIIYQIWVNKYTSADELLCLCIAQRELVSFSLTEVLLQKQHITSTILALIIQISIIWTSHIYFWLVTGTGYLILGKWTDKSYGNRNVCLTTSKLPLCIDQLVSSSGVTPVLAEGDHQARDSLSIQKECGSDNICVPDLSVRTRR